MKSQANIPQISANAPNVSIYKTNTEAFLDMSEITNLTNERSDFKKV